MKKTLLSLTVVLFMTFISTNLFAQPAPGDDGNGNGGYIPPDDGGTTGNPTLVIDLGVAGVINIISTSPYYTAVRSILNYFHIPIVNGVVTFTSFSCYNGCLSGLYYSRIINYNTWHTACNNPPPGCH